MSSKRKQIAILCALVWVPLALALVVMYPRPAVGAAIPTDPLQAAVDDASTTAGVPAAPLPSAPGPAAPGIVLPAGYYWNYSAKFVCGVQPIGQPGALRGEPPVKPGNYATSINIHNYNYKPFVIRKKFIVLVENTNVIGREPPFGQPQGPRQITYADIGPDFAMMEDCNSIYMTVNQTTTLPATMPLMEGYVVVISPLDLDIDTVFTAEVPGVINPVGTGEPNGISIDVERIPGKRVFVPN